VRFFHLSSPQIPMWVIPPITALFDAPCDFGTGRFPLHNHRPAPLLNVADRSARANFFSCSRPGTRPDFPLLCPLCFRGRLFGPISFFLISEGKRIFPCVFSRSLKIPASGPFFSFLIGEERFPPFLPFFLYWQWFASKIHFLFVVFQRRLSAVCRIGWAIFFFSAFRTVRVTPQMAVDRAFVVTPLRTVISAVEIDLLRSFAFDFFFFSALSPLPCAILEWILLYENWTFFSTGPSIVLLFSLYTFAC